MFCYIITLPDDLRPIYYKTMIIFMILFFMHNNIHTHTENHDPPGNILLVHVDHNKVHWLALEPHGLAGVCRLADFNKNRSAGPARRTLRVVVLYEWLCHLQTRGGTTAVLASGLVGLGSG